MNRRIDVIATTISGSISDWGKVEKIVPLLRSHGEQNVHLAVLGSHAEARATTCRLAKAGSRIFISAGGSGTFNSVVEGCYDAAIDPADVRLGFLRKGSADLIGKVLGMPDHVEDAVAVMAESIRKDQTVPCDVLRLSSETGSPRPRHFVGYGGAEIFGEIPRFTENRFMKYYKGVLGQLFGDLGPFFVGMSLAVLRRVCWPPARSRRKWTILCDGQPAAETRYQAMILVNGDLGPNLDFAKGVPLGSGDFYLFGVRDLGMFRLPGQLRNAWSGAIKHQPDKWGFDSFRAVRSLVLRPDGGDPFPINADGSIMECRGAALIERVGQLHFLARAK